VLRARDQVGILLRVCPAVEKLDTARGVFSVLYVSVSVLAQKKAFAHRGYAEDRITDLIARIVEHLRDVFALHIGRYAQAAQV